MMLSQVDSGTQNREPTNIRSEAEYEFRVCKGNYIGIVRPNETHYEFLVRDTRREGPTIYGSGVDFSRATTAVTELLDGLVREP
jgi:hypothetical protein